MRGILAIAWRETASCFRTPLGWVVVALYLLVAGLWVGFDTIRPGEPASLRAFFSVSQWLLLLVAPAVSMRLLSEEFRLGTIEPLAAAPVGDYAIALGKYLGGVLFLVAMLAPSLIYVGLLEWLSSPDYGPILAGYVGLLLVGMLYLAAGTFFSTLTSSQVVAFLTTVLFFVLLFFATDRGAAALGEPWSNYLYPFSIGLRLRDFAQGVIDTAHIAVFVLASAWFILLAGLMLESRRWR